MLVPLLFVLSLALATALICLYVWLAETGTGKNVVRISRQSRLEPEAAWANLQSAWGKTGLTFQPARFLPTEDRHTRIVINTLKDRVTERILKIMPAAASLSVGYRVYRENGEDYPYGTGHFERWSVIPAARGSRIEVVTQGQRKPFATGLALLSLWRKAGLVASERIDRTVTTLQLPPFRPSTGRMQDTSRKTTPKGSSRYSREAVMSIAAFVVLLIQYSWQSAVVLAGVILFHEYGHLLSYQLTGKKGNRLMLVPFFGGIAVAGAPHKSEFERAFCALAGPGICTILTAGGLCLGMVSDNPDIWFWAWKLVYFSAILNLLNLLPIYPLDGGHTTESYLRSYFPSHVARLLMGTSLIGLLVILGMGYLQTTIFFGLFAYLSLKDGLPASRLRTMSAAETVQITLGYLLTTAIHAGGFYCYFHRDWL